jgi:DNA-binding LytR/AlgR family response regulator
MMKPFFIWHEKLLKRIDPGEVLYLQTKENYTTIYLSDKTSYMIRSSLFGALKKLPGGMYIRIHDSIAVSIYYMDDIARDHLIIEGVSLPINWRYYDAVIKQLDVIGKPLL